MDEREMIKIGRVEYSVPREVVVPVKSYLKKTFGAAYGSGVGWSIYVNVWDAKNPQANEFIGFFPTVHYIIRLTVDDPGCLDDCPVAYHYIIVDETGWKSFHSPETFNSFISVTPAVINMDNGLRYAKLIFSLLYADKSRYSSGWSVDETKEASLTAENGALMAKIPSLISVFGPFHPQGDVYHVVAFLTIDARGSILSFRQQ